MNLMRRAKIPRFFKLNVINVYFYVRYFFEV